MNLDEVLESKSTIPAPPSLTSKSERQEMIRTHRRLFLHSYRRHNKILSAFLEIPIYISSWVFVMTGRFVVNESLLDMAFWLGFGVIVLVLGVRGFSYASFHSGMYFEEKESEEMGMIPELNILCLGAVMSTRFFVNNKFKRRDENGRLMKPVGYRVWEDGFGSPKVYPRQC